MKSDDLPSVYPVFIVNFVIETVCWSKLPWSLLQNLEMLLHNEPSKQGPQQYKSFNLSINIQVYEVLMQNIIFSFLMCLSNVVMKCEGLKHAQISSVLVPWCNMCKQGSRSNSFPFYYTTYYLARLYSNVTAKIFNLLLFSCII